MSLQVTEKEQQADFVIDWDILDLSIDWAELEELIAEDWGDLSIDWAELEELIAEDWGDLLIDWDIFEGLAW